MNHLLRRYKKSLFTKLLTAFIIGGAITFPVEGSCQDGKAILNRVDQNLSSRNQIAESSMTIHGRRSSRTITAKSWTEGDQKSFTEYLSPASEAGTKMLKLQGQLWIYTPAADRTIQISGHLLRQSVMGSDLSYEDMMDDRKLSDVYDVTIAGKDTIDSRGVIILELTANVNDIAYYRQKMWVDSERFIPLKQEMYARSGQLLKRAEMKNIKRVENRWYPSLVIYKDMLKEGKGTEFRTNTISFDQQIPDHIFSKASLR